ncbi:uncharacterized protein LOC134909036 [Pseudophryne corroboree]|uniref:uncharacterized protein LOC134909036 n=1 Tax=Pseudophryne corroboree TaxID=495146 RepID=UPI003081CC3D
MGSGSSKSRRRATKACSHQPLDATQLSRGNCIIEGRVACDQEERQKDKGIPAKSNVPTMDSEGARLTPIDTDLQLLDDVLAESESCLSWQESTRERQTMRKSPRTNCNPGSLSQVQENHSQDEAVLRMLHDTPELETPSPEGGEFQNRHQTTSDSKRADVSKSILDTENNNLLKCPHTCPADTDTPALVMYDDTEETLMDSIEQEFSQLQPNTPVCCLNI